MPLRIDRISHNQFVENISYGFESSGRGQVPLILTLRDERPILLAPAEKKKTIARALGAFLGIGRGGERDPTFTPNRTATQIGAARGASVTIRPRKESVV